MVLQLDEASASNPRLLPQAVTGRVIGAATSEPVVSVPVVVAAVWVQSEVPPRTLLPQTVTGAVTGTPTVEPVPESVPPDAVPDPVAVVQVDDASESRPTLLPQAVTGAVTGAATTLPSAEEPVDEPFGSVPVLPPVSPVLPAVVAVSPPPRTLTALPVTVTGAVTGTATVLSSAEEPVAGAVEGAEAVVDESSPPRTLTALPVTVTGAVTGTATVLSSAEEPVDEPAPAAGADVALVSPPSKLIELPLTLIGAATGALTAAAVFAVVVATDAAAAGAAEAVVPPPDRTLTELPVTFTGAVTGMLATVWAVVPVTPLSRLLTTSPAVLVACDPMVVAGAAVGVSAAEATAVPMAHVPPATAANCSPRLIHTFMVGLLSGLFWDPASDRSRGSDSGGAGPEGGAGSRP
jgi:hypothetical protein